MVLQLVLQLADARAEGALQLGRLAADVADVVGQPLLAGVKLVALFALVVGRLRAEVWGQL